MITFKEVVQHMMDLQANKDADYGNSFGKTFEEFGPLAAVVRINDKTNRLKTLVKNGTAGRGGQSGEAIYDTLTDLAAYSLMTIVEMVNAEENVPVSGGYNDGMCCSR